MTKYKTLDELITLISGERKRVCQQLMRDFSPEIQRIAGSTKKHQAWEGGYIAHITEAMNIALVLYDTLGHLRPLSFTRNELLFAVFLHDFDKVIRFSFDESGTPTTTPYKGGYEDIIREILAKNCRYQLTENEYNAIKYAHGEGADYHPTERVMLPLATLVHCSDVISARVWHEYGKTTSW